LFGETEVTHSEACVVRSEFREIWRVPMVVMTQRHSIPRRAVGPSFSFALGAMGQSSVSVVANSPTIPAAVVSPSPVGIVPSSKSKAYWLAGCLIAWVFSFDSFLLVNGNAHETPSRYS